MFNNADVSDLKYRPRLQEYKNNSGNLRLYHNGRKPQRTRKDKFTHATSYGWYTIFKRINGKNVLNTYRYSNQTGDHIDSLVRFLKAERVKIHVRVCLEDGLGDLKQSLEKLWGKFYDRQLKDSRRRKPWGVSEILKDIKTVEKLGAKLTLREKMQIKLEVEKRDAADLAYKREKRAEAAPKLKAAKEFKKQLLQNSWVNVA